MVRFSSSSADDTLKCRLLYSGIRDFKLDSDKNLTYIGDITCNKVTLPYGVVGLVGTGFSGLPLESLKFNKDLVNFEYTSLSNCKGFKRLHVYENQLHLVSDLKKLYPDIEIIIRKEV